MKIYTRTGDGGTTALYGGERRSKADLRISAYGEVDEVQAALGVAVAHANPDALKDLVADITAAQYACFTLCAQLARTETREDRKDPSLEEGEVEWLESRIDSYEKELPQLKAFIMQGGSPCGAFLHLARVVCRRAERSVTALADGELVDPLVLRYLNRLSDFLFVAARVANHRAGVPETEWHPKKA